MSRAILVDMDCVIADLEGGFLAAYRAKYPHSPFVPLDERTTFYMKDQYKELLGEDASALVDGIVYAPGFVFDLPAVDGAIPALVGLLEAKHDVRICTAPFRNKDGRIAEKMAWVDAHLGPDWVDRMVITRDKTVICGDYLIDDKKLVTGVHCPSWEQVLFERYPYNRDSPIQKRMTWQSDYQSLFGI